MSGSEMFFTIFEVLGGLALFIFGMNVMTSELRTAAGTSLRTILSSATGNRLSGFALGTAMGFLMHSSAATVMLTGFINAGLLTLTSAAAPVFGANLGTTLSMQVVSFRLDDYCFAAMALGLLYSMITPSKTGKSLGRALLGFGLLFLGMRTMSGAIRPHRELLAPLLTGIDGSTLPGMLTGILISVLLTAIVQSSGAVLGMNFALISAGVFTSIWQAYPVILGASIGTCITALLSSIGTNIEARRGAFTHLLFNIFNVTIGIAVAPWLIRTAQWSSPSLVRQAANLHTTLMIVGSLLLLPFIPAFVWLVRRIVRSSETVPAASHLDPLLLKMPEQALAASIRELQRTLMLATSSMRRDARLFFGVDKAELRLIQQNEKAINEIKLSMKNYLRQLARSYLSRRQVILMQLINRCMTDIERIGDHIDEISQISVARSSFGVEALVDAGSFEKLFSTYLQAYQLVARLTGCLVTGNGEHEALVDELFGALDDYSTQSEATRNDFAKKVAAHQVSPLSAFFFSEYLRALDRITYHIRNIALCEKEEDFNIKSSKWQLTATTTEARPIIKPVDPQTYLDRLDS